MANNPIIWATVAAGDFSAYYRRCARIVAELAGALRKLHDMGYVFVDLNPHNVLIGADDSVRLIDFELAAPPGELVTPVGAPGFFPQPPLAGDDMVRYDEYGLSSLALAMIAPLNTTADHNPAVLTHLRHQLDPQRLVPDEMWTLATRFRADRLPADTARDAVVGLAQPRFCRRTFWPPAAGIA